jgi:hypothetical protein
MSTALVDAPVEPTTLPIGAPGPSFSGLLGTDGRRHSTDDHADRDALVLVFSSNRCPTAKAYGPRLVDLARDYGPRGVQLIAINSNDRHLYPDESYLRMVERAAEDGYTFPYVLDEGQVVGRAYGASCTFHVFVLDRDRRVRYEGRFDDSRIPDRVTSHDLRNALDDLLADRPVSVQKTRPFGCSLDYL